ncbi:MAG: hypothetical protein AB7S80_02885 [Rhizobiaceae bacterium]
MISKRLRAGLLIAALALAGCNNASIEDVAPKASKLPDSLLKEMSDKGMNRTSSIMARIYKEEGKLEIWKMRNNGRYALIKSYNICKWSGQLGPKFIEGDRQAPEGFYTVRPGAMNPNSGYHLSFNIGYPNAFDRAHGRTGANLMVHGECSSQGCYSMENRQIEEIYALAREAFKGGQTEFQVQAFPFRMTAANMARYRNDPNYPFWQNLKEGYDQFEITKVPPKVDVCEKRYVFNQIAADGKPFSPTGACPASTQPSELIGAYQSYKAQDEVAFARAAGSADASKPLSQTIAGIDEAKIVQEWTRKRGRGERVPVQPPAMHADGQVTATALMGRIDSPAGRRMAALEAAEAEKKKAAEAKKRAEEEKKLAAAQAKAEKEAAKAAAAAAKDAEKAAKAAAKNPDAATAKATEAAAEATAATAAEAAASAPAEPEKKGLLGGVRKRIGNIFGS